MWGSDELMDVKVLYKILKRPINIRTIRYRMKEEGVEKGGLVFHTISLMIIKQ